MEKKSTHKPVKVKDEAPLHVQVAEEPKPVAIKEVKPTVTEDDKIWSEIKHSPLEVFGLPGQTVEMHCVKHLVDPSSLYITFKSGAALQAFEDTFSSKFNITFVGKYTAVSRK